jgi:hypothetical protein
LATVGEHSSLLSLSLSLFAPLYALMHSCSKTATCRCHLGSDIDWGFRLSHLGFIFSPALKNALGSGKEGKGQEQTLWEGTRTTWEGTERIDNLGGGLEESSCHGAKPIRNPHSLHPNVQLLHAKHTYTKCLGCMRICSLSLLCPILPWVPILMMLFGERILLHFEPCLMWYIIIWNGSWSSSSSLPRGWVARYPGRGHRK